MQFFDIALQNLFHKQMLAEMRTAEPRFFFARFRKSSALFRLRFLLAVFARE